MDNGQPSGPQQPMAPIEAMLGLLRALAPAHVSDESVVQALGAAMREEQQTAQIYEAIVNEEQISSHPFWGFAFRSACGDDRLGPFVVHKTLGKAIGNQDDMARWALTFGALTSPLLRALFMIHGYKIEFTQAGKPGPKIHVIKGG